MPNFSISEVLLVRYPFSDLTGAKVRPSICVGSFDGSPDHIIVPLTSRTGSLADGEFILGDWAAAGLHIETAVKRGIYTIHARLVVKSLGRLTASDGEQVKQSLRQWLKLS